MARQTLGQPTAMHLERSLRLSWLELVWSPYRLELRPRLLLRLPLRLRGCRCLLSFSSPLLGGWQLSALSQVGRGGAHLSAPPTATPAAASNGGRRCSSPGPPAASPPAASHLGVRCGRPRARRRLGEVNHPLCCARRRCACSGACRCVAGAGLRPLLQPLAG